MTPRARGSHEPGDLLRACRGPVVVQGITGRVARRHTGRMRAYGTPVVAGVTPGRDGENVDGIPVFGTVRRAVEATGASVSVAFLPPVAAAEGLVEAAEAGIRLAVSTTEGAAPHGMLAALAHAERAGMSVIGPNSPGLLIPDRLSLGFLPGTVARAGPVALVSRSGTLSYEVARALSDAGLGESAWIGVGGDRFKGTTLVDLLPCLEADPATRAVAFVGEIGGTDEEAAARALADSPLACAALIAGRTAPVGTVMGHAGALVGAEGGGYRAKAEALLAAGVQVALSPREMAAHLAERLRSGPR
ncbi:hypothetical protein [Streptomyces sp. NBRC 109706]|uniref:succinate--CoA ligase subunit alpha n=1 Tax=Streptomyces sp. NBRC 109706 TaxID=1550035 RepID=UPI00099CE767|nr:hypothetical protein [Streptomyces sp. NBRC 109706]